MPESTVQGRVVNKRPLSRRLVFLEVECEQGQDVELLLKPSDDQKGLSAVAVHSLRDAVKVGDIVSATGVLEPGTFTFRVFNLEVLEAWKFSHAGISFVPKLLPSLQKGFEHTIAPGQETASTATEIHGVLPADAAKHQPPDHSSRPLCKYWVNAGKCLRGDACQFRHVLPSELPELRKGWVVARRRHRQELSNEAGNPHGMNAAKKSQRAAVLCDWLIATFGSEALSKGSGVLDIAGGRGNVSFELQTVRGIRCTLIDPRPQKISKTQKKWLQRFKASAATESAGGAVSNISLAAITTAAATTDKATSATAAVIAKSPMSAAATAATSVASSATAATASPPGFAADSSVPVAVLMRPNPASAELPASIGDCRAAAADPGRSTDIHEAVNDELQFDASDAQPAAAEPQPRQDNSASRHLAADADDWQSDSGAHEDLRGTLSQQYQAEFKPSIWTDHDLAQQLQSCSLVLGLHPDQATDSIVDFALQFGKPFAVVPCCVFPRQFQHRQLHAGIGLVQPVLTHAELVEYLLDRSSGSKEYLPFEGMNQVVYRHMPPPKSGT